MPPAYTTAQKGAIAEFMAFASTSSSVAAKTLKSSGWNIEQAIDANTLRTVDTSLKDELDALLIRQRRAQVVHGELVKALFSLDESVPAKLLRANWPGAPWDATEEELEIQNLLCDLDAPTHSTWLRPAKDYQIPKGLLPCESNADLWDTHLAMNDQRRIWFLFCHWMDLAQQALLTTTRLSSMMKFALRRPWMGQEELHRQISRIQSRHDADKTIPLHDKLEIRSTSACLPQCSQRPAYSLPLSVETRKAEPLGSPPASLLQRYRAISIDEQNILSHEIESKAEKSRVVHTPKPESNFPRTSDSINDLALIIEGAHSMVAPYEAIEELRTRLYAIIDHEFDAQLASVLNPDVDPIALAHSLHSHHSNLVDNQVQNMSVDATYRMGKVPYSAKNYVQAFKYGHKQPTGALLDYIIDDIEIARLNQAGVETEAAEARIMVIGGWYESEAKQSTSWKQKLDELTKAIEDPSIDPSQIVAQMWFDVRRMIWRDELVGNSEYRLKGEVSNVLRDLMTPKGPTIHEASQAISSIIGGSNDFDIARYISQSQIDGFIPYHRIARRIRREARLAEWMRSSYQRPENQIRNISVRSIENLKPGSPKPVLRLRYNKAARIKTIHQDFLHDQIGHDQAVELFRWVIEGDGSANEDIIALMVECQIPWDMYFHPEDSIMQTLAAHIQKPNEILEGESSAMNAKLIHVPVKSLHTLRLRSPLLQDPDVVDISRSQWSLETPRLTITEPVFQVSAAQASFRYYTPSNIEEMFLEAQEAETGPAYDPRMLADISIWKPIHQGDVVEEPSVAVPRYLQENQEVSNDSEASPVVINNSDLGSTAIDYSIPPPTELFIEAADVQRRSDTYAGNAKDSSHRFLDLENELAEPLPPPFVIYVWSLYEKSDQKSLSRAANSLSDEPVSDPQLSSIQDSSSSAGVSSNDQLSTEQSSSRLLSSVPCSSAKSSCAVGRSSEPPSAERTRPSTAASTFTPRKKTKRLPSTGSWKEMELEIGRLNEELDALLEYHKHKPRHAGTLERDFQSSSEGTLHSRYSSCTAVSESVPTLETDDKMDKANHDSKRGRNCPPGRNESFTQWEKRQSREYLANFWNYRYFQKTGTSKPVSTTLNKIFDEYRDDPNTPDLIGTEGTVRYLSEIDVALDEPAMLSILALTAAPTMGELSRSEFLRGWDTLGVKSISQMKAVAVNMRSSLASDTALFKKTYKYAFVLAKPPGQKGVQLEAAVEFWRMLFGKGGMRWKATVPAAAGSEEIDWLNLWIEFVEVRWRKAVSRDLWDQTLIFAKKTMEDPSLEWWSEEAAWPGLVDEFVGWVKARREEATASTASEGHVEGAEKMDTN